MRFVEKYGLTSLLFMCSSNSHFLTEVKGGLYSARNLEMAFRFSLKSWLSERFHRPEMSQIKAKISLRTNVKLNFHKNVGCQMISMDSRFL